MDTLTANKVYTRPTTSVEVGFAQIAAIVRPLSFVPEERLVRYGKVEEILVKVLGSAPPVRDEKACTCGAAPALPSAGIGWKK